MTNSNSPSKAKTLINRYYRLRWIIVVIGLISVNLAYSLGRFVILSDNWRTFESDYYGITIDYPARWYLYDELPPDIRNPAKNSPTAPGNELSRFRPGYRLAISNGDNFLISTTASVQIFVRHEPNAILSEVATREIDHWPNSVSLISSDEEFALGVHGYPALNQTFAVTSRIEITIVLVRVGAHIIIFKMASVGANQLEQRLFFEKMLKSVVLVDVPALRSIGTEP